MLLKSIAGDEVAAGTTKLFETSSSASSALYSTVPPVGHRSNPKLVGLVEHLIYTYSISAATGNTELFETSPVISPVPRMSLDFPTAVLDFLFLIAPAKIAKR